MNISKSLTLACMASTGMHIDLSTQAWHLLQDSLLPPAKVQSQENKTANKKTTSKSKKAKLHLLTLHMSSNLPNQCWVWTTPSPSIKPTTKPSATQTWGCTSSWHSCGAMKTLQHTWLDVLSISAIRIIRLYCKLSSTLAHRSMLTCLRRSPFLSQARKHFLSQDPVL